MYNEKTVIIKIDSTG